MLGLVGKKIGMTRIFNQEGDSIPVTVIEVHENRITQVKTIKNNLYNAIQVTTGNKRLNKLKKPESGHFIKAGVVAGRGLWEFRINNNQEFKVGETINVNFFTNINKVDITGISKGKGFSGTVKRWNFRTQDFSHGNSLSHRAPGSIGQNQTPGRVFKGKKMAGHLGNSKITIQSLKIVKVDINQNLLLVKGSVPGSIGGNLIIKPAVKVLRG
ncbi:50S ribosomal protein L3 [Buchnera aphidicola (Formosaphis micheliae)]|uniref:50S ribosomal protein L3 n=1 Tax=Buchnera aphidicola TaxID=9 RepID=UPI0031B858BC